MAGVKFDHVYNRFNKVEVVQDINMDIKDKEFLVLVGPSGCGKSTCLRMIAGLEEVSEGEISIGDRVVNNVDPKDRDIAMVFQNYALYPHMTVYDNMAFRPEAASYSRARNQEACGRCGRYPRATTISQAQAQRTLRRAAPARGTGPRARAFRAGVLVG